MPQPESSSSAPLPSSAQTEAMQNPYAAINTNERRHVPQEMTARFTRLMKMAVLRNALPTQSAKSCVNAFLQTVHKTTPFRFDISGKEALEDADIILANHQGPQVDAEGTHGLGGTECLYAHAVIPPKTRFVLKKFLVEIQEPLSRLGAALLHRQWKDMYQALSSLVKARAFLKTKPITVDRTLTKPPRYVLGKSQSKESRQKKRAPWKTYVKDMRQEREHVAGEITKTAMAKNESVIVYPEGTRSPDGQILGFVSEYFEKIVADYIIPRMMDEKPIRIGILVADTLSAFPNGVGKTVPAYDRPITLRGIRYDPSHIVDALRDRGNETKLFDKKDLQKFGRMLLMDIHDVMSRTLEEIVQAQTEHPSKPDA